ncbi:DUF4190 domain-containing protein [Actinoallomurus iriomotensis]|jgi:Domain of unknown function (DUF4190)/Septum formation|uniref:DUF4190 domain-containing protein n=1 Tax=Actinoallomurus iriomotensis TaxID=478107 RepID=A0A9W6SCG8_9ACTN|nr:DUF4190 domain-containing protein [Actinoallomurus iriomotensis]GLY91049.1 hypothetical protein Airi02_089780 [Actinoallomurus iriomotensis]
MSFQAPATQPGWYGAGPDGGADRDRRRSTNGLAVTSLILGILGFLLITIPLNLILGIAALVRTRRRGDKGVGLAVTGLILSLLWAVGLGVGVFALSKWHEPKRDASGQINSTQKAAPDTLRVGDCVAPQTGEVRTVQAQPCTTPGSNKVFSIFSLPQGAWPGESSSGAAAERGCTRRYQAKHATSKKQLDMYYFSPTKAQWTLGDRKVICLVGPVS